MKQRGFTAFECVVLLFALISATGWVLNVVKLIGMIDGSLTAMFVARVVGVFAVPLGAILGFI